jgi:hypothetical protein
MRAAPDPRAAATPMPHLLLRLSDAVTGVSRDLSGWRFSDTFGSIVQTFG